MDNKENRQFYWSVKDFGTKQPDPSAFKKKQDGVVDSVKSILEQNKLYTQKTFDPNSSTVNVVSQALSQIQSNEKGYNPSCKAYSKNVDTNAFRTLNEAAPGGGLGFGGGGNPSRSGSGQSWREKNPEQYAANVAKRQQQEEDRKAREAERRRIAREDEGYEMKEKGIDLEMDKDNPNLPADTPENRKKLRSYREEKYLARTSETIGKELETLSKKDPNSLSEYEAARLNAIQVQMRGPNATPGLEQRVREKLEAGAQAMQGPMPDGGNRAQDPGDILAKTVDRPTEELVSYAREQGKREREAKLQQQTQQTPGPGVQRSSPQTKKTPSGEIDPITGEAGWDGRFLTKGQRSNLGPTPGVELSPDTPDWVSRWAQKLGDDPRKIEAMRLGVLDVLDNDPTKPMDYSMSPEQVTARGEQARMRMSSSRQSGSSVSKIIGAFTNSATPTRSASQTAPRTYRL